jgi:hypothetical protein
MRGGRNDLIPLLLTLEADLYVSIGSNDGGVIYYDLVGLNDEPLRKIANSFEEFINGCRKKLLTIYEHYTQLCEE